MLRGKRSNRLNLVSVVLIIALAAVPLAIAFAAEKPQTGNGNVNLEAVSSAAVISGRVTNEAGAPLADAQIRVAYPAIDMRFIDTEPEAAPSSNGKRKATRMGNIGWSYQRLRNPGRFRSTL